MQCGREINVNDWKEWTTVFLGRVLKVRILRPNP